MKTTELEKKPRYARTLVAFIKGSVNSAREQRSSVVGLPHLAEQLPKRYLAQLPSIGLDETVLARDISDLGPEARGTFTSTHGFRDVLRRAGRKALFNGDKEVQIDHVFDEMLDRVGFGLSTDLRFLKGGLELRRSFEEVQDPKTSLQAIDVA